MLKHWVGLLSLSLRTRNRGWVLILVACAIGIYINTAFNGFVYDDRGQILDNQYVRSFHYLPQIFGSSVLSFAGMQSRYYRPMMTFGYLLCYKAFGFSPAGFHIVNISFHALIVALLFFLTHRVFGDRLLAFGAAALFALHPIHTESVAWIAAITDLELTFFYLLTFWLFLALDKAKGRRAVRTYVCMAGSFALALLSKEQAVTLPFLATIYEHFYRDGRGETSWARKVSRYSPLWILAAAYIPLRLFSLGGFAVTSNHWDLSRLELLLAAMALLGQYLWKLLWPLQLCAFYVFETSRSVLEPAVLAGLLSAILLCAVFWWLWKNGRRASFGVVWLMATLAPVLNARWLGVNVFAERYLYLPSIGFCWMVAWGVRALWRTTSERHMIWRRTLSAVLAVLAVLWSIRIVTRNRDWQDDIILYSRTLESSPDADLIRENLAVSYANLGLFQDAEQQFRAVLERDPDCAKCLTDFAELFIQQARYAEAKPLLTRAVTLDPKSESARLRLGLVYQKNGAMEQAAEQFEVAGKLAPKNVYVHTTMASFYEQQGDYAAAEAALRRALAINPYNSQARLQLGGLYETGRRREEAVVQFQNVLQNDPGNAEAIASLRRLRVSPNP